MEMNFEVIESNMITPLKFMAEYIYQGLLNKNIEEAKANAVKLHIMRNGINVKDKAKQIDYFSKCHFVKNTDKKTMSKVTGVSIEEIKAFSSNPYDPRGLNDLFNGRFIDWQGDFLIFSPQKQEGV